MKSYFFILGRQAAISCAEILAVFRDATPKIELVSQEVLVASFTHDIGVTGFHTLGGTIKFGEIIGEIPVHEPEAISHAIRTALDARRRDGRITFGISAYGTSLDISKIGIRLKKEFREAGNSVRYVAPQQGNALTSVVVDKNELITSGGEFVVIEHAGKRYLGETKAVQAFEAFSESDYGRPGRDTFQGMLPPKLARIMVNLAESQKDATLLDPFCGSGTVLTEALQLGYPNLFGSDSNPEAITQTERNLAWFKERRIVGADAAITLHVADARNVGQHLAAKSVDAVVTETFLGPPRKRKETRGDLQRTLFQLEKLYYQSLSAWTKILKKGAVIVIALPYYVLDFERHGVSLKDCLKLGYEVIPLAPPAIFQKLNTATTKNGGLIYGRDSQLIHREIVKLRWAGK